MTTSTLVEMRNALSAHRDSFAKALTDAKKSDGTYDDDRLASGLGVTKDRLGDEIKRRQAEIDAEATQVAAKAADEGIASTRGVVPTADRPDGDTAPSAARKSIARLFVESDAYTKRGKGGMQGASADITVPDLKTLFSTSAGWSPESTRIPGLVILDEQRGPEILDLIPQIPTRQAAVKYMEETTYTSGATEKAEGAAAGESAFVLTERSQTVETLPVSIPATEQQLEDVEEAEAYLNSRLRFQLKARLDSQVVNGDGVSPNFKGILNATGLQTQALGTDTRFDAIHKAITKVLKPTGGNAQPNAVFLHSGDWEDIRLTRTTSGIYILGNPGDNTPRRLWGLPVVINHGLTEGTGLAGDFQNFCAIYVRRDITFAVGYVNDDFTKLRRTILAYLRAAVVTYRGAAFCQVTGL